MMARAARRPNQFFVLSFRSRRMRAARKESAARAGAKK